LNADCRFELETVLTRNGALYTAAIVNFDEELSIPPGVESKPPVLSGTTKVAVSGLDKGTQGWKRRIVDA